MKQWPALRHGSNIEKTKYLELPLARGQTHFGLFRKLSDKNPVRLQRNFASIGG